MKNIKIVLITLLSIFSTSLKAQDKKGEAILGTWLTGDGSAKVNIFKTKDQFYGSIVWLKIPLNAEGKPKVDDKNPDEKHRERPLIGLLILRGFVSTENNLWENGKIYDPKNGKDYSCKITMIDNNKLDVRGFIGISLLGRTETWTRIN
jgi:uncharacterized protein (DUF2147 family)